MSDPFGLSAGPLASASPGGSFASELSKTNELLKSLRVRLVPHVIRAGHPARPKTATPVGELLGLAGAIIRYSGPYAVRRDADPVLVEAVQRIGWEP